MQEAELLSLIRQGEGINIEFKKISFWVSGMTALSLG